MIPAPETGEFVELLLLNFCAGMSCSFLKALSVFLLGTTLSTSYALDSSVGSFTSKICTTTSTMLAEL
jgi:hypothetical protein